MLVIVRVCVCLCTHRAFCLVVRGQFVRSGSLSYIMWVLRIKLRSLGLGTGSFTYWAMSLILNFLSLLIFFFNLFSNWQYFISKLLSQTAKEHNKQNVIWSTAFTFKWDKLHMWTGFDSYIHHLCPLLRSNNCILNAVFHSSF